MSNFHKIVKSVNEALNLYILDLENNPRLSKLNRYPFENIYVVNACKRNDNEVVFQITVGGYMLIHLSIKLELDKKGERKSSTSCQNDGTWFFNETTRIALMDECVRLSECIEKIKSIMELTLKEKELALV